LRYLLAVPHLLLLYLRLQGLGAQLLCGRALFLSLERGLKFIACCPLSVSLMPLSLSLLLPLRVLALSLLQQLLKLCAPMRLLLVHGKGNMEGAV
jgi:hypothetical protein